MNSQDQHKPTWRKPAGVLAIVVYIAVLAAIVSNQWEYIGRLHILVQSVLYLILGIIWILPLRPLMIWMETGKFKAEPSTHELNKS
jgi:hypothetical protein